MAYWAFMLASAAITVLHLYDSRRSVFGDDGVLHEVVIVKLRKFANQGAVALSSDGAVGRDVPMSDIVRPTDPYLFIRFSPIDDPGHQP